MYFKTRIAGIIGNFLEHYDNALFGLLAPFLAPLFFEKQDPLTALILTYGILPMGFITKPLGSFFFGWFGDRFGRRQALCISLVGMSFITICIGCLPVYKDIGIWAPIWLALGRMMQSFFAAGESAGGAIYVLEHTPESKRGFLSGCYDASTVGGILLASFFVTLMSAYGNIDQGWRVLFWIGGITAFCGIFIRLKSFEGREFVKFPNNSSIWHALKENKQALLAIVLASGFTYTTYSLTFTLMNGYIPLVTSLTKTEVMKVNTILLVVDMFLLPVFGYLASKIGKEKVMLGGALGSVFLAIPLFSMLDHATLFTVIVVRLAMIVCGVAFGAPYYAWALERAPKSHRYLFLSFGAALGSQIIGYPTSAVCLWLYQALGWSGAPALYLLMIGSLAMIVVRKKYVEIGSQHT